jgi:small-conductance mechanosensitive channel
MGPHSDLGGDFEFSGWRDFRFTTRHLLILTAVLAVVFTIFRVAEMSCNAVFWLGVVALAAGWYWVYREERRREAERQRQRTVILKSFGREAELTEESSGEGQLGGDHQFKFSFSLKQLFITMTATAVLIGILKLMPTEIFSLLLGLIAVAGIVAVMAGFEAPPVLVLAWWILLVLYILVSIFSQVKQNQAASRNQPSAPAAQAALV